jgi:ribosome-binding protein aMBF1 (putative translation factor)
MVECEICGRKIKTSGAMHNICLECAIEHTSDKNMTCFDDEHQKSGGVIRGH